MPELHVEGIRYAYIESGAGPLVLFAHGTFGAKEAFAPQLAHLARRYRCVSIDLPGHGNSSYAPDGWTIDDLVRAVPALITGLGERRAVLAGVSQGGAIFMRAALAYPQHTAALVIMCAGAATPPPELMKNLRDFARFLRDEHDETARRRVARQFLAGFHAPALIEAGAPQIEAELERALAHPREAMPLVAEVPASYRPVADQLQALACPALVLWGAHDFRPGLGAELAARIPGAELRTIAAAGHHVHVDAPFETAHAIGEFLNNHLRSGTGSP